MKTSLIKDGIKEVKNSYKRFLSLLLIVLLGVGFFAGIKATSPDMKKTLDTYFDNLNVMDVQVISTLGLTDDDINAIQQIENVENVEGAYQADAIVTIGEEEVVVKLETMTSSLNNLNLVEGRLPENENECVVEPNFLLGTGHQIGDTIEIEIADITNDDGDSVFYTVVKEPLEIWPVSITSGISFILIFSNLCRIIIFRQRPGIIFTFFKLNRNTFSTMGKL